MSDVIHRTTLEQRFFVNTPDYPTANWIINPDLSALSGISKKYWKVSGETVIEMSQAEKDAVDAAEVDFAEHHIKEVYKPNGQITERSWWAKYDSGTDDFTHKVRSTTYNWSANKQTSIIEKTFDVDGSETSSVTRNAEEDANNNVRRWRKT